jgi:hypothetical protein
MDVDLGAKDNKLKKEVRTEYELFNAGEGNSMQSLFGMGRVFLGGVSNEGVSHSSIMRHTDIATIDRFRVFAQRYVENYKTKKPKRERMSHAQS